ncbi:MAG: hypothetical protein HYR64_09865, partial [Fimbriimonas ginsengisoli]|nr:hypothetical protein [Fimbriimonas ginsengisoli]
RAQIGRFLNGDRFSPEALKQLEGHIGDCPDCKVELQARKATLQAMLTGAMPETAPTKPKTVADVLRQQAGSGRPAAVIAQVREADTIKPKHFWKPFGYSLALAGVLIGMSVLSRNMDHVLGTHITGSEAQNIVTESGAKQAEAPLKGDANAHGLKPLPPADADSHGLKPMPPSQESTQSSPKAPAPGSPAKEVPAATTEPAKQAKSLPIAEPSAAKTPAAQTPKAQAPAPQLKPTPTPALTLPRSVRESTKRPARHIGPDVRVKARRKAHHHAHPATKPKPKTTVRVYTEDGSPLK